MQMEKRVSFLGIPVDCISMQETISIIDEAIQEDRKISHVVINAGKVVAMQNDKQLFESVVSCDIINADGQSIVWAARLLGKHIPERVTGSDLMPKLVKLASEKAYKCFFLGAKEEIVSKVTRIYREQYGEDIIVGYRNGYFNSEEEEQVALQISKSNAQLLFVAITTPKKENFLYKYKEILQNINFTMGVGGTFDIISAYTKRAPLWMQNLGLEWFFRLIMEPRRMWKRYLVGNSIFIWLVLKEKLRQMLKS
jgi:N-acetylglucosaminyldiphosphoundecaprenol N-acetyl-beta-D-mannosaminyltransferase